VNEIMNKKKNIIVFMTDQQNASVTANTAKTPNLDAYLQKAVTFSNAYCTAPHCCPSRASFFTGLMPSQHGVWNNVEVDNALSRGMYEGTRIFPELLQKEGYHTAFSGKWHISALEWPKNKGFDKVLHTHITNFGAMGKEYVPKYNEWIKVYIDAKNLDGKEEVKSQGRVIKEGYPSYYQYGLDEDPFGDNETVELACKEIMEYDYENPMFLYIGTTGPHDPYFVPQEFLDLYKDMEIKLPDNFQDDMLDKPALYRRTKEQFDLSEEEHIESIRHYLAFISYEDYLFGKVQKSIREKGIEDDTIVLYLTDHGDYVGAHGLWAKGLPCFKEAYHICAAIGGGGIGEIYSVRDELVSIMDFAPTILELAGVSAPWEMCGRSLVDFLYHKEVSQWRTEIFTQTNGNEIYGIQRAVWNKKWKYVFNSFDYDELYDLEKDPDEMKNIAKDPENKQVIYNMCKKMWQYACETKDNSTCGYIMVRLAPYGPGIIHE